MVRTPRVTEKMRKNHASFSSSNVSIRSGVWKLALWIVVFMAIELLVDLADNPTYVYTRVYMADVSTQKKTKAEDVKDRYFLPLSKWASDMGPAIDCGSFKCAFRSQQHPTEFGYVVAQEGHRSQDLASISRAIDLAYQAETEFGIRHLYQGPPQQVNCTIELLQELNRKRSAINATLGTRHFDYVGTQTYDDFDKRTITHCPPLIVQPIRLASPKFILFYTLYDSKRNHAYDQLEQYFGNQTTPLQKNELITLQKRLNDDLKATKDMLDEWGCLLKDFQILVDPDTGTLYHLDFERCWETKPHDKKAIFWLKHFTNSLVEGHTNGGQLLERPKLEDDSSDDYDKIRQEAEKKREEDEKRKREKDENA